MEVREDCIQPVTPYGGGSIMAFLICGCFCPFFLKYIFKSGIITLDRKGQWYQHLLTLFAIVYENNTEGTNFRIMFVCFM